MAFKPVTVNTISLKSFGDKLMNFSIIQKAKAVAALILLSTFSYTANATLANNLQSLVVEAQSVNSELANINLTSSNMCSELQSAHNSAETFISNINTINESLSAPITIDHDSLQALDDISSIIGSIAASSTVLSMDLTTLNNTTDMLSIKNGLTTMLRLSDDIGTMADRILEMSNKILVMADNIGAMADRIIVTQQIQSQNLALTQSSILATQQNSIALVSVVNSSSYETDFDAQTLAGNILSMDIAATFLTTFNMANQWADIATDVDSLKAQVEATHAAITAASESNTVYVDAGSYAALAEMSIMVSSVSIAAEGLAIATEGMSVLTRDSTLDASMGSILKLSTDIGTMANRILEMSDLILAMSDNIGLTADQIIATQTLQSTNYAATLASVETTQQVAISIIAINSL